MLNLPSIVLIVGTVKSLIKMLSDLNVDTTTLGLNNVLRSTNKFIKKLIISPLVSRTALTSTTAIQVSSKFNIHELTSNYPEILHLLSSIANFDMRVKVEDSEVLGFKFNPKEIESIHFNCKGDTFVTEGGEILNFDLDTVASASIILDLSVYMSRFAFLPLHLPRMYLSVTRSVQLDDRSFNMRIRVTKMDMSGGGVLMRILPLKRFSKYLSEKFELDINLSTSNELKINYEIQLPKLPGWFYKVARFFVKKTAGGMLKVLRDFVGGVEEDLERIYSGLKT